MLHPLQAQSMQSLEESLSNASADNPIKELILEGKPYAVPSWVNHIKKNDDGSIYGFQLEPIRRGKEWYGGEAGIYPVCTNRKGVL